MPFCKKSPPDILIYTDSKASVGSIMPSLRGSFPNSRQIRIVGKAIAEGALRSTNARLLVIPGVVGDVCPYPEQLGEAGIAEIREFAHRAGHSVLTVCAGTYLMSQERVYRPAWADHRHFRTLTPLFNGAACGPIPIHGRMPSPHSNLSDVTLVPVRFRTLDGDFISAQICYGNGPVLHPDPADSTVEILAHYEGLEREPAAIVRCQTGDGSAYMSGILPEIGWLPIENRPGLERANALMNALEPHEPLRRRLWDDLTRRIALDLA